MTAPLLEVEGLTKHFGVGFGRRRSVTRAAEDVSFSVGRGEIVGLIGESGSGKSTVGRSILRLEAATSGSIRFEGEEVLAFGPRDLRRYRRRVQAVFQDPASSLDPRLSVRDIVGEPMAAHGVGDKASRETRVVALLAQVGLGPDVLRRRPHAFSGGQRQRIAIARALATDPRILIFDEATSALDATTEFVLAENLRRRGCTCVLVAHRLSTIRDCDEILVVDEGVVVERGRHEELVALRGRYFALVSAS